MDCPQSFSNVFTVLGLELGPPAIAALVWANRPLRFQLYDRWTKERIQDGEEWYNRRGQLHRELDSPCQSWLGQQVWKLNGRWSRANDKPTQILTSSTIQLGSVVDLVDHYWADSNGNLHRDRDQPAHMQEWEGGWSRRWYQHGELHRDGDRPAFESSDGQSRWYRNGKLHRDNDLPAIVTSSGQSWWSEGERHRDNGPQTINSDGTMEFWIRGQRQWH